MLPSLPGGRPGVGDELIRYAQGKLVLGFDHCSTTPVKRSLLSSGQIGPALCHVLIWVGSQRGRKPLLCKEPSEIDKLKKYRREGQRTGAAMDLPCIVPYDSNKLSTLNPGQRGGKFWGRKNGRRD